MDDGTSNGGQISGLAVCQGVEMGSRLGQPGDKRLELRDDGKMYIVDSTASVGEGTRDASEFHPALIVDGVDLSAQSTWTGPQPRAVLGQSDRLETMMVIVEGRLADSPGCSVVDVAAKMVDYGCVQALNLDGGTSAIMYYKGRVYHPLLQYRTARADVPCPPPGFINKRFGRTVCAVRPIIFCQFSISIYVIILHLPLEFGKIFSY